VEEKVKLGLEEVLELARSRGEPFSDESVLAYFEMWKTMTGQGAKA
jgi:hypothetical protein